MSNNKSLILDSIIYPNKIVLNEPTSNAFNKYIQFNLDEIIENIYITSQYVEVKYLINSASYVQGNSFANFIAKPASDYSWKDGTNDQKIIKVIFSNVVAIIENDKSKHESKVPLDDIYMNTIYVKNMTNQSLNESLDLMNINFNLISKFLSKEKEYKNIGISYILQSANIKNKSFKILASPIQGYDWDDGYVGSKIIKIKIQDIKLMSEKAIENKNVIFDASAPEYDEWHLPIFIEDSTSEALKKEMKEYRIFLFKNLHKLSFFNKYSNVDIAYLGKEKYFDINNSLFKICVKPKKNHSWLDGTNNLKNISIFFKNLKVASVPIIKNYIYEFKKHTVINQTSIMNSLLDEVFSPNNLKLIYKEFLTLYPYTEIISNVADSQKILNRETAQIKIVVKPKEGYAWMNKQNDPIIIPITVKNIYISEWYPFRGNIA